METAKETRKIVRLMATDLDGNLSVEKALRRIKGIGFMFSKAICIATSMDPKQKIGLLSDDDLKQLENVIRNPPLMPWLLNRRKDTDSGQNLHLTGATIDLRKREDINILRRIRAYRGIRHEMGQPVRGQRTRSSFRTQRTVGVTKKAAREAAAGKKEEKK